jgi:hypothetical protein
LEAYYKDLEEFEREFGASVCKSTLETSRDLTLASAAGGFHTPFPSSSLSAEYIYPRGSNTEKLLLKNKL